MAKQNEQRNWLQRLWGWVQQWLRGKPQTPKAHPTILKRWYGEHCAVLLLKRTTKGAIATYRAIPKSNTDDHWLLTWDDVRERDTERLGRFDKTTLNLRPSDSESGYTHGFSVWRIPQGSNVPILVGAWSIKLVHAQSYSERRRKKLGLKPIPVLIAESVALHLRDMQLVGSWQERMEAMDWVRLIELYATAYFPSFNKYDCYKVG